MSEVDCSVPPNEIYKNIMHYFHVVTFPFYIVTLYVLAREKTIEFQNYKVYITAHILLNILNEFYVCFLMLPVTYLPYPVIRATGWLAKWNFSGLLQYFIMVQLVIFVGVSIMKMMVFRFKACVTDHKKHLYYKILKYLMWFLRFLAFTHLFPALIYFDDSLERQKLAKLHLYETNFPSLPQEVTCHTAVVANVDAWISKYILATYVIMVVLSFFVGNITFGYIVYHIRKYLNKSKNGLQIQRMLIISLFVQGSVHSILLTIPCVLEGVAVFWNLNSNTVAQALFPMVAYHGFVSTCAMIAFAKPLRFTFLKLFGLSKPTNVIIVSGVPPTVVPPTVVN